MRVIARFLDCYKYNLGVKGKINNLVHEYHEYRILEANKENKFVAETCTLIK